MYLARICDTLGIERRQPDKWEVMQVLAALGAMQADFFNLAATYVDLAMAPPQERTEAWRDPDSGVSRQELQHAIQCERLRLTSYK